MLAIDITGATKHRPCSMARMRGKERTLNANMDVVLDLFDITGVVVGFGEGVCSKRASVSKMNTK